ncbi:MAG TPA: hypothetical protein VFD89_03690 [Clostridia bacterium]|nr:hypothetical protein [Clostridia bacterium]
MKADINLGIPGESKRIYLILVAASILVLLMVSIFMVPIHRRNLLRAEYIEINRKLLVEGENYRTCIDLENYSANLFKKVEILGKVDTRRGDVGIIIDLIDKYFSKNMELSAITISKNIVNLNGTAPNDGIIADSVLMLQGDERVTRTRIEEISLDTKSLKRVFNISFTTLLNNTDMDGILSGDKDDQELDQGGVMD